MKKFINVFATVLVIVILKGCAIAPVYLCFAPIVTAYRWGFRLSSIKAAILFEYKGVWHTLCNDWRDGCEAFVFDVTK